MEKRKINVRRLAESGILLALAFILSYIKVPLGPTISVSLVSMLPVIILAYKYGTTWGLLCGLVHGALQMVEGGVDTPPTENVFYYILVVLLDYLLAFAMLGLAGLVRNVFKKPVVSIISCCVVGVFARFVCSFLSGWIIWGVYAPKGQPAWLYSLIVNGTKFGVDGALVIIVAGLLFAVPAIAKLCKPIDGVLKAEKTHLTAA